MTKSLELILAPDTLIQFKEIDKCFISVMPVIITAPGIILAMDVGRG